MMAICKARTVCFSKLATVFDSPAKAESCLRRIQRFFSEHSISQNLVAKFIFQQLPKKEKYRLAIDRTNWQFGKTDINIFMLAIVHEGVAYPLLFTMLPKKRTSNSQVRINLVQRYICLFGQEVGEAEYLHHVFYIKGQACYLSESRIIAPFCLT